MPFPLKRDSPGKKVLPAHCPSLSHRRQPERSWHRGGGSQAKVISLLSPSRVTVQTARVDRLSPRTLPPQDNRAPFRCPSIFLFHKHAFHSAPPVARATRIDPVFWPRFYGEKAAWIGRREIRIGGPLSDGLFRDVKAPTALHYATLTPPFAFSSRETFDGTLLLHFATPRDGESFPRSVDRSFPSFEGVLIEVWGIFDGVWILGQGGLV